MYVRMYVYILIINFWDYNWLNFWEGRARGCGNLQKKVKTMPFSGQKLLLDYIICTSSTSNYELFYRDSNNEYEFCVHFFGFRWD